MGSSCERYERNPPHGAHWPSVGIAGRGRNRGNVRGHRAGPQIDVDRAANIQHRVTEFLVHNGGKRFCAPCVARAVRLRSTAPVMRAMKALANDPGYRVEEAECSRCDRTALTIRALWTGM